MLAAPLFREAKQRASGGRFSDPEGFKVARRCSACSGAGLSGWLCFVWGFGPSQQNHFEHAEGLDAPGLELVTSSQLAPETSGWPKHSLRRCKARPRAPAPRREPPPRRAARHRERPAPPPQRQSEALCPRVGGAPAVQCPHFIRAGVRVGKKLSHPQEAPGHCEPREVRVAWGRFEEILSGRWGDPAQAGPSSGRLRQRPHG